MTPSSQSQRDEIGRSLGFDLFRFGRSLGVEEAHAVGEGFAFARERRIGQEVPDRFMRKWLQLRLNAYRRDRVVDPEITPRYLEQIDVSTCPVTRVRLTHGERQSSDWSIDRLNNDGAYAPGNLAVISTGANQAKGNRNFDEVMRLSDRREAADGLTPPEWLRLAAMMLGPSFADHPSRAPIIPLATAIPNHTARSATQIIQFLFTRNARAQSGKNALIKRFRGSGASTHARVHLTRFAEALHQGLKQVDPCWDVWLRPDVMLEFRQWRSSLTSAQWAYAGVLAVNLLSAHRVSEFHLQSWHLPSGGYLR